MEIWCAYILSTWETEVGGSQDQIPSRQLSETLSQNEKAGDVA